MFTEPDMGRKITGPGSGWIEVISGCMFSGKTEELIRRLNRAIIAGQKVTVYKPGLDTRYHHERVVSHRRSEFQSRPVSRAADILALAADSEVVGIDEAQFFDAGLPDVCNQLANEGKRVIAAGLDMDYEGKPFGPMPHLLAIAEFVTKLHAICMRTGALASFSYRLSTNDNVIELGEMDKYEARSRRAYLEGMKPQRHDP